MPVIRQTPHKTVPPAIERRDNRDLRDRFPRLAPDIEKQRRTQPYVTTAPQTPSPKVRPSAEPVPRRSDEGRIRTTPPQTVVNQPGRRDQTSIPAQADKHTTPSTPDRRGESSGQGSIQKEQKQKKVWKVATPEQGSDKDVKEKEGKEHRGRR
jgi:hypothetical protein